MGSSKEKTKKKVEADVEFSTPIKFFFELSPPKLQSRVHSFSPTSRRGCARAGRPLRGSAPSRPSSGRGRPPSLPRVPLRLRRQRSVCFAVVAVSSGRRRNRLSSPSLALSLFAPISMPCRSPTRARRRIGAGEKTTGRRREPAPPRASERFPMLSTRDASDFRMRLPSQSPPLSRFSLSSFLRLVLRYSLTQSQAEDGPLKVSAMEIEAPAKGRSGAEGTTTAATMTVSADAATRPLAPAAAAAAAAAAALPPRLPKEERAARPAPKKAKKEAAAAAVPAEKAAAAAEDASEEEEEEDAPVAVGKRPRRAAAAAARKRAVVRDDDSDEEEEDGSDDDDSSSESDFSEAAAAQEETEDVSWTGGGEKREGNERGKRDERGCRRNFPASTPFSSHSLSHR